MPILENPRHERFAQGLAAGKSQEDAYADAGFKPSRSNASTLAAKQNILERVAELASRAVEGVVLTKQWVLEQLIDNAAKAKNAGDFGPSNQALNLLGKELGMFTERSENVTRHVVSPELPTAEQWASDHVTEH